MAEETAKTSFLVRCGCRFRLRLEGWVVKYTFLMTYWLIDFLADDLMMPVKPWEFVLYISAQDLVMPTLVCSRPLSEDRLRTLLCKWYTLRISNSEVDGRYTFRFSKDVCVCVYLIVLTKTHRGNFLEASLAIWNRHAVDFLICHLIGKFQSELPIPATFTSTVAFLTAGIPWHLMSSHGILWHPMVSHGTPQCCGRRNQRFRRMAWQGDCVVLDHLFILVAGIYSMHTWI